MTRPREELIRELASDLAPAPRLASATPAALVWLLAGVVVVAAITLATGPLRPGLSAEIASEPGLVVDLLLGALAAGAAAVALMRLRIPGLATGSRAAALPLLLFAAWGAWQLIEWTWQAGPPSTLGHRDHCAFDVILFALPPLALGLWLARRAAPLECGWTGLVAGLAAGVLPALAMQVACMEAPLHSLGLHLAPVLAAGVLG
ncbi:MAG: NrsF family protein, partial [Myxococcota bacterium]